MKMINAWREFEQSGFFNGMRMKLLLKEHQHQNEEKISDLNLTSLVDHLDSEVGELKAALYNQPPEKICEELVDVANMCAFLYAGLNPNGCLFEFKESVVSEPMGDKKQ